MTEDEIKTGFQAMDDMLGKHFEDPYTRGMWLIKQMNEQCRRIDEVRNSMQRTAEEGSD